MYRHGDQVLISVLESSILCILYVALKFNILLSLHAANGPSGHAAWAYAAQLTLPYWLWWRNIFYRLGCNIGGEVGSQRLRESVKT